MVGKRAEKVTAEQKNILIDFMSDNMDFARGKLLGPEGKITSGNLWQILCQQLSAVGPEKNIAQWQRVWKDIKLNLKKKISTKSRMRRKTGGGSQKDLDITDMEQKVMNIITKISVCELDGPDGAPLDSAKPIKTETNGTVPIPEPGSSRSSNQLWVSFVETAEKDIQHTENICKESLDILSPASSNRRLSSDNDSSATPQRKRKRKSESAKGSEDIKDFDRETVNEVKNELKKLNKNINKQNELHKNTNEILLRIALALEGKAQFINK